MKEPRRYSPREVIAKEGTKGHEAYVILKGRVAVHAKESIRGVRTKGDVVGEMALVDGTPRSATLSAVDDVRVEVITLADFRSILNTCHPIVRAVVKGLCKRLREADHRLP